MISGCDRISRTRSHTGPSMTLAPILGCGQSVVFIARERQQYHALRVGLCGDAFRTVSAQPQCPQKMWPFRSRVASGDWLLRLLACLFLASRAVTAAISSALTK